MLLELVKNVDTYMSNPPKVVDFWVSDMCAATFLKSLSNIRIQHDMYLNIFFSLMFF